MRACFQLRHRPCLRPPAHAQRLGQSAGARTGLDRPVAKTDTIALWPLACSWMIPRCGGFMQDRGSYSTTQSKTCRRPQRHEARDTQKVSARFASQRKASGIPSVVRVRQRQHSRHPPQAPLLGSGLCRDPMFWYGDRVPQRLSRQLCLAQRPPQRPRPESSALPLVAAIIRPTG